MNLTILLAAFPIEVSSLVPRPRGRRETALTACACAAVYTHLGLIPKKGKSGYEAMLT